MNRALTNVDLTKHAAKLGIDTFRGVYSKDLLPDRPRAKECGIVNLQDSEEGEGTHWTAYRSNPGPCAFYFDSFGLRPPKEVTRYLKGKRIIFNRKRIQQPGEVLCGQYCLFVLFHLDKDGSNLFNIADKIK